MRGVGFSISLQPVTNQAQRTSRTDLVAMLHDASELEHMLTCEYLYASSPRGRRAGAVGLHVEVDTAIVRLDLNDVDLSQYRCAHNHMLFANLPPSQVVLVDDERAE